MSAGHSAEHEAWIEQALLGETPLEPRAAAELQACEPCRRHLADLRRLRARLDEAGVEERAVLLASRSADGAPAAEAAVREFLARREPRRAAPNRRKLVWLAALAAASVVAAAWLYRNGSEARRGRAPILLGTGAIQLIDPIGPGKRFETFSWRADVRPGTHFSIMVWSADGQDAAPLAQAVLDDDATQWTPAPQLVKQWPDAIRWEVRAQDPAADHEEWASGTASR